MKYVENNIYALIRYPELVSGSPGKNNCTRQEIPAFAGMTAERLSYFHIILLLIALALLILIYMLLAAVD